MHARKYFYHRCPWIFANSYQSKGTAVFTMPAALSSVCHVASGSAVLVATLPPLTLSTTLSEPDTKKCNSTRLRLSEIRYWNAITAAPKMFFC